VNPYWLISLTTRNGNINLCDEVKKQGECNQVQSRHIDHSAGSAS